MLIVRMMKREKATLETSCREDELRNKGSNDEDDDPSAAGEGEQPSTTTKVGVQTSAQGESTKEVQGSGSGKGVEEEDETIDALLGIDDMVMDDEEEELEEGEMLPTEVDDWQPDDTVLPDLEADVDEHIVINQSKLMWFLDCGWINVCQLI